MECRCCMQTFTTKPQGCRATEGWVGFQLRGGGGDTALWLDLTPKKKRLNRRAPQNPTETEPRALEVTRTQNSAKNENGPVN